MEKALRKEKQPRDVFTQYPFLWDNYPFTGLNLDIEDEVKGVKTKKLRPGIKTLVVRSLEIDRIDLWKHLVFLTKDNQTAVIEGYDAEGEKIEINFAQIMKNPTIADRVKYIVQYLEGNEQHAGSLLLQEVVAKEK
jgi:hypothetical protein